MKMNIFLIISLALFIYYAQNNTFLKAESKKIGHNAVMYKNKCKKIRLRIQNFTDFFLIIFYEKKIIIKVITN